MARVGLKHAVGAGKPLTSGGRGSQLSSLGAIGKSALAAWHEAAVRYDHQKRTRAAEIARNKIKDA